MRSAATCWCLPRPSSYMVVAPSLTGDRYESRGDRRALPRRRSDGFCAAPAGPGLHPPGSGGARPQVARRDDARSGAAQGELSPIMTGLMYCSVIDACCEVYELRRAREWTFALSRWCEQQSEMVAFTGACLVHRAEILQFHGAWPEALAEAGRAYERLPTSPSQVTRRGALPTGRDLSAAKPITPRPTRRIGTRAGWDTSRNPDWPCYGSRKGAPTRRPRRSAGS